jgi:chemotaxis protein MotB
MKKTIIPVVLSALIFSSCGTSKKLDTANAQIATLNSQITTLNEQNTVLNTKLSDCNKQTAQLKEENIQYGKEAEDCRKAKEAAAKRWETLNKNLEEQGTSMEEIRAKAAKALSAFHDANIEVTYKNGLVYISMQDQLMFPSGSTKMQDMGRQALSVVADVLAEFPHVHAIVVGNTDTLKVIRGFKDNWSLSTERANTIVRILRDNYGADPSRLTSAGRGKYNPVASNDTPEGRAKNRRTDIIINPDLDRLWYLSQKQ